MLRKIPVVLFLLLMTSCGALSNLSKNFDEARGMISDLKPVIAEALDNGQAIYNQGKELVAEMKTMEKAAFKKADKDGDGDLDLYERITYLALLAAGGVEVTRRKMKATQSQIAQLHNRVDHERSKRKAD